MARFLLLLLVAGSLWGAFGPAGLAAGLALWLGLTFLRHLVSIVAGLAVLVLLAGWVTSGGGDGGNPAPLARPALPYKLLGFRWPEDDLPLRVDLSDLGAIDGIGRREVRAAARSAMASWNHAAERELLAVGRGGPVRVVARDCGPGNSALTRIHREAGGPSAAVLCINDPAARFSLAPSSLEFELETVLLHELGHVLGLAHPVRVGENSLVLCELGQPDRVMCPRPAGRVTRTPLPGDVDGIRALYR